MIAVPAATLSNGSSSIAQSSPKCTEAAVMKRTSATSGLMIHITAIATAIPT
ncbi:hypothetical protein QFZ54_001827 [Sphingomonas faeni]|nr:hypothetical protein [Sphingomonas faeni]